MGNTFTQIYIQIVFAVSGRINFVRSEMEDELQKYITGIITNKGHKLLAIGGMPDHLHLFVGMKPDQSISSLVNDVKSNSSKFVNEKTWFGGKYAWQAGFGAFSYSRSHLDRVVQYVRNQKEHHLRHTFRQEYTELLQRFEVSYDEKYLFEFYDDER